MSAKKDKIQTPLARARGLGSAKEGFQHWWDERISAVLVTPLSLWVVWSAVSLRGATHAEFTAWLADPLNAVLTILFILSAFFHGAMGAQVIIEDYIHTEWFKLCKIVGEKLFLLILAVVCIFAVLKVAL